jgi:MFS family permease
MQEHKPRAFFYGYIIVIAGFFAMLAYSASRSVFGIFFNPMINELHWSAALLSGAFSLSIIMDGTLGIVMGKLTDRFGPKTILISCGLLAGAGYLLLSRVTNLWQMYLVYGIIIGTGMSGVFIPVITNLSRWFIARRSTMNGIVLTGMGLGTLIVSPIAYWLVSTYSWQTAYIAIGIAFLFVVLVSAQFMRQDPFKMGQQPFTKIIPGQLKMKEDSKSYSLVEALRTKELWLVFVMFFFFGYCAMSISVHVVPHIINLGISAATASLILAVIGGVNIAGRLTFGWIGDRLGPRQAYGLGLVIIAGSALWLLFIKDVWMLYIFAVLWGFSAGGMGSVQTSIVAELFGVKSIGIIFGFCGMGVMVGGSVGPVISGHLFDVTGNYQVAFLICAVFAVAGAGMNLWLGHRRFKRSFATSEPGGQSRS